MTEIVGGIFYEVDLDTGKMIDGQRKVKRELDKTTGSLDGLSSKLTQVAGAISVLAIAMSALKSAQMADDMRLLGAKVQVAAGNIEAGAAAMKALEAISKRTSTSVAANAEVFTRLNQSILQMGGTQQDTLNITELLGKAIRVSGASAVEAKSAMLQFGQALGSGKLAGDELRSLMETAPYLMRQLADGIGVPVGALKQLGEEGKLTSDVVTNALSKAATQIDADFQKFPQTIASAMEVAMDAAGRANSKLDELTGTSLALTGITKGVGEVFDELAIQFGEATTEADKLGRNDSIKTWSEAAKFALSYVIDAGDGVIRTFKAVGTSLGGLMAASGAALSGEFSEARSILGMIGSDLDALASKPLAGQKMRDQFTSGAARPGPVAGPTGTIKSAAGAGKASGAGKGKGQKFDGIGYLADLRRETVGEMEKLAIAEAEDLRKNSELLASKKINREQYEEAMTLIIQRAATARKAIADKELDDFMEGAVRADKFMADRLAAFNDRENRRNNAKTNAKIDTLGIRAQDGGPEDKENLVRAVGEADIAAVEAQRVEAVRIMDLEGAKIYADQKVAIESEMNARIASMRESANQSAMNSTMDIFGSLVSITKNAAGEQSAAYKVAFAAQKAYSIASAIVAIQTGIAAASAKPWPLNLAAMASVAAATASIVSTISGTSIAGGRQYGGPVSAGSMYRVNETGAPEMFTAGNGSQFMLPSSSGKVTAADKVGGGGVQMSVQVINNHPTAQVTTRTDENGRNAQIVIAEVANQIASNSGPIWSAMRGATNIQGRM